MGGLAGADVKYKVSGKDWRRPGLYQSVAFAAAAQTVHAAIVGLAAELSGISATGSIRRQLPFAPSTGSPTNSSIRKIAADHLAERVEAWLDSCD